jgi:hypothetical protein
MTKILRLTVVVCFLTFVGVARVATQEALTCHVDSGSCPQFSISCDWEEPSDCYTDEPAWDLCEDVCFWNCPAGFMIDYVNSYGSACWEFNCACHIVG